MGQFVSLGRSGQSLTILGPFLIEVYARGWWELDFRTDERHGLVIEFLSSLALA